MGTIGEMGGGGQNPLKKREGDARGTERTGDLKQQRRKPGAKINNPEKGGRTWIPPRSMPNKGRRDIRRNKETSLKGKRKGKNGKGRELPSGCHGPKKGGKGRGKGKNFGWDTNSGGQSLNVREHPAKKNPRKQKKEGKGDIAGG